MERLGAASIKSTQTGGGRILPWIPETLEGSPEQAIIRIEVEVSWDGRAGRRNLVLETVRPSLLRYDAIEFRQAIDAVFPG